MAAKSEYHHPASHTGALRGMAAIGLNQTKESLDIGCVKCTDTHTIIDIALNSFGL